jgi:signal transduction histidine kinase/ActR/RegA family two-component response regulator
MNKPSYKELEQQINAQKITIEHLKKTKLQLSQFFDSTPKNIKIIELIHEGNKDAKDYYYRYVNPAFMELVGKTKSEIVGKRLKELFENIDEYWFGIYNEVAHSGNLLNYKSVRNNKGNYYEIYAWKIQKNLIGVIFADITKHQKKELQIIADKERAEKNDRIKNNFISNLSHEIRTPMNGILGFTKFLSDPKLSDIKREHYINIIQNSGNQLMRTMDDLLEFSKLGTNQVRLVEKEICLNNLFLELFTVFDVKARENKIPLYLKKGLSDKKSTVLIDGSKLNNILGNLLENALKFTKEGFIEFGYTKVESNLEIYVKDTGIGIKTTRQKSVFERFSKEEEESTKNIDGLGLGLWIAKENTELLGGKISLESKKNSGTTFYVKIPYNPMLSNLKENSETPSNEYLEEENNDHKYTILIAEDEEINFLFLEILLKNQIDLNCTIIHAKNGVEAVEICKKNTEIDIVFMDLKMPVMDGFESVKLIKEFRPDLPIVAQTAFSSNEDKEKVFNAGFNDFISKPISIEDLDAVINRQKE